MSSLFVALPIVCCLLIPAAIWLGVQVFRRPEKRALDTEEQKKGLDHPIGQDSKSGEGPI